MKNGDIAVIWADLVGVRGLFAKLMFFNVKSKPGVIYPVTEGKGRLWYASEIAHATGKPCLEDRLSRVPLEMAS